MTTNPQSDHPKDKYPKPAFDNEQPQAYPGLEHAMDLKPDYGLESYKGSAKLTGKVALITGGDSGIGRAVAVAYAREGADVVISYLSEEDQDAQETVKAIESSGRKAIAIPGDIKDESHCMMLVNRTVQELGKIDILVNNAAFQKYFEKLDDITMQDFEETFRVNVFAPFVLSKAAAAHMKSGSSIINTVSIQAYEPSAILTPYASSKGALTAMTKGLSEELVKKGIRVNAIAPGPIWSPLNTHGSPPEKLKKFGESTPLGRPGQPVELAPLYVLLASQDGSYIAGEVYGITGGRGIA